MRGVGAADGKSLGRLWAFLSDLHHGDLGDPEVTVVLYYPANFLIVLCFRWILLSFLMVIPKHRPIDMGRRWGGTKTRMETFNLYCVLIM